MEPIEARATINFYLLSLEAPNKASSYYIYRPVHWI